MQVEFDAGDAVGAVAHLETEADAARHLAVAAGRLGGDLTDPALAEGVRDLGDLCGDALEVGGLALDLLAAKARAAAACYDRVEDSVARTAGGGRR